jgi:hypothetical protein
LFKYTIFVWQTEFHFAENVLAERGEAISQTPGPKSVSFFQGRQLPRSSAGSTIGPSLFRHGPYRARSDLATLFLQRFLDMFQNRFCIGF